MVESKKQGKKVVIVGHLYEEDSEEGNNKNTEHLSKPSIEIGKFLLTIPKDLRREVKFEADEKGYKNTSDYICHILQKRH